MKIARYLFCVLLGLSGLGHFIGTFLFYTPGTDTFVWSLSASAFVGAVITFNLFALSGRTPHLLAAAIASLVWTGLALAFGQSVGKIADPRVLMHAISAAALAAINIAALLRTDGGAAAYKAG